MSWEQNSLRKKCHEEVVMMPCFPSLGGTCTYACHLPLWPSHWDITAFFFQTMEISNISSPTHQVMVVRHIFPSTILRTSFNTQFPVDSCVSGSGVLYLGHHFHCVFWKRIFSSATLRLLPWLLMMEMLRYITHTTQGRFPLHSHIYFNWKINLRTFLNLNLYWCFWIGCF